MSTVIINGLLLLDGDLTCDGDVTITSHGKVIPVPDEDFKKTFFNYPANFYITANGCSRAVTSTAGNLIVNGVIAGKGMGFNSEEGPGCNCMIPDSSGNTFEDTSMIGYGATHAGMGYIDSTDAPSPLPPYGHHETPVSLGSGSGFYHNPIRIWGENISGGGAIKLVARSGNLALNGFIDMNGTDGTHAGGAAGGSIWAIGWNLDGTGHLRAEGGSTRLLSNAGGGGGGYISLWYENNYSFTGRQSVIGQAGGGDGKLFRKQIEPILEDRFTGTILNSKWWDSTGPVSINNELSVVMPDKDYTKPVVESEFTVCGKDIVVSVDYKPDMDTTEYSAEFLMYCDSQNWAGVARRKTGLFGISAVDGLVSASGIPYDNTNVSLRIMKTDSTFLYQFHDYVSAPQTIYADVRPELANKHFKLRLQVDKPSYLSTVRSDCLRLTSLDIAREYVEADGTASDQSSTAMNITTGTSQYFGFDFYVQGNKFKWDSTGLSAFTFPIISKLEEVTVSAIDLIHREVALGSKPVSGSAIVYRVGDSTKTYGVDYIIAGNHIIWSGLALTGVLTAGDILRVSYDFDITETPSLSDVAVPGDVVRLQYGWEAPANDEISMVFDNVKVMEGAVKNAESKEAIVYVDADHGSDSSSGDQLSPLKNLFVATAWAKRGGIVVLYDGTYNPTYVSRKDLTIKGAAGALPVITSQYSQDTTGSGWETNALSFYGCQGIVDNVYLKDSTVGVRVENGNFDIVNNTVSEVSSAAQFINCDPVIARNRISNAGLALDFSSARTPYIYSNLIYDSSVGMRFRDTTGIWISGDTMDTNQTHIIMDTSSSGTVASNNLTYATLGMSIAADATVSILNNNFYGTVTAYTGTPDQTAGNIDLNPLYYDRSSRDYHITLGSPNIGAGTLDYDDYRIDFDGLPRPAADIGSYQYKADTSHSSAEYYVAGWGDDLLNTGDSTSPFKTLDHAMVVSDSTLVNVDGGHYDLFYLRLRSQINLNQLYINLPENHFLSYITLTAADIENGYVSLPGFVTEVNPDDAHNVALNPVGGPTQIYAVDYRIQYGSIIWKQMSLENYLTAGDILRVLYSGFLYKKALNILTLHGHYSDYGQEKAIFVAPSGSDSTVMGGDGTNTGGDGSIHRPYRTVSMALSMSSPGDNIVMFAGEYPLFENELAQITDRVLIPARDKTSVINQEPRRYYEDRFNQIDFRAFGMTDYESLPWTFSFAGDSTVTSGGGFLNLTYDGTNTASAVSDFDLMQGFEVFADLRNGIDPIRFEVSSPDNTAYFSYDNLSYAAGIITGGESYICRGVLDGDMTSEDNLIVEYIAINSDHVRKQYAPLSFIPDPADCTNVAVNVVGGTAQTFGVDFYIEDSKVKWDNGMINLDELEAGEVLRVIYKDDVLSPTVRVWIALKNNRFTIKVFNAGRWITVNKRDLIGTYTGSWKTNFVMDTPDPDKSHDCIYGKGFVSKFLAITESFENMSLDKPYVVSTDKRNVVFYKERV